MDMPMLIPDTLVLWQQPQLMQGGIRGPPPSHYQILGVERDATLDTLRKAYQAMVLSMHPDRNAAGGAHEAFHAVQLAWETLRDPDARRLYDATQHVVAAKQQLAIADEVDLDEMTYDAKRRSYTWPCRCSSYFEVDEPTLERGVELLSCYGCSSHIKVLYQTADT